MAPTNSEVIFWCVIGVLTIAFWIWGASHNEPDVFVSDHWIDRNIYGKK